MVEILVSWSKGVVHAYIDPSKPSSPENTYCGQLNPEDWVVEYKRYSYEVTCGNCRTAKRQADDVLEFVQRGAGQVKR